MIRLEPVLQACKPDLVMVFGDVNSTVAAALCAAKLGIDVAHVEAGLRSFDRSMPEELNRIVTDHVSDYLFTTEASGNENLSREGIPGERIFFVGNVMVDTLLKHRERARRLEASLKYGLQPRRYGVLTLHRPSNFDDPDVFLPLLRTIEELAQELPLVFPCHLRTQERLRALGWSPKTPVVRDGNGLRSGILLVEPLGYLECLSFLQGARMVLTDSGGIQEETTVLGVPCLTLRENTERPVTVQQGTNMLVGTSPERILKAASVVLHGPAVRGRVPELWDGRAAERIASIVQHRYTKRSPRGGLSAVNHAQ